MLQTFLSSLEPAGERLLVEVSKHISDDMLVHIARADYGKDQEKHLAALRLIRDQGIFVEPMCLYPCEVLELTRHYEPEGPTATADHWIRLFACAALLRAREEPWNYCADPAEPSYDLILLIKSLQALPPTFTRYAASTLAWMMLRTDLEGQDEQPIYFGVGLLWLSLNLDQPPPDDGLIELSAWIVRREAEIHESRSWAFDRWLLGIGHDPPPSPWESLGEDLSGLQLGGHRRELQDWVKLIGAELSGRSSG